MASVQDVAAYILRSQGRMSTWKLQKLVYYAQAWHLVWDDEQLFPERIEAWANGPVIPDLYQQHRGKFAVDDWEWGDADKLSDAERNTVDIVLRDYGGLTGRRLSHLTHDELPWREAREGLGATERSNAVIEPDSMAAFYEALDADPSVRPVDEIDWAKFEAE